jgi:UDP-N-acetylmuramoyl-L-alanyl-D-glutamate--2,6-diaminopimelate ligase
VIEQAVQQGASAVIMVGKIEEKLNVPCACLPNMQAAGLLLRRWFQTEKTTVSCIGITGTDGKTSVAWMLREVLEKHLGSAWSVGTLGWSRSADEQVDLGNTTPSLMTLHRVLALAEQEGIGALVLEVSSHGIEQQRIAGIPFISAIWTTMGHDHLEDHGSFEAYLAHKTSFVKGVAQSGDTVVANADNALIQKALEDIASQVSWYAQHQDAALSWHIEQGVAYFKDAKEEVSLKQVPVADFHVENLAAVALLMREQFGLSLSAFQAFDGELTTPTGRLEPVDEAQQVFIDYAHTAEGLQRCLQSARKLTQGQLLLVFGCGGNRDKSKRPEMGAVAMQYADICWLTSDNPRHEAQDDIAADVLVGVGKNHDKVHVVNDRAKAIAQAVQTLDKSDKLVIAGKGHESYIEIQGQRLPWSDKTEARKALKQREVQSCA